MRKFIPVLLIITVILISGCVNQAPTVVDVEDSAVNPAPHTEIRSAGQNAEILITPSDDDTISGIVTVAMSKVPADTKMVAFAITQQGEDLSGGPNLGIDGDGANGWKVLLDTTKYGNGLYTISGFPAITLEEGDNPLGIASAQAIIEN